MQDRNRVVAVGLLTRADVELLGTSYNRLWPVEETPCFGSLLAAIDDADRQYWREQDKLSREIPSDGAGPGKAEVSLPGVQAAPRK